MTEGLPDFFHPLIKKWFDGRFREPTAVQKAAWPKIAKGEHVLISAPTGSGKTLTAFLYAIDRLAVGAWTADATRVLYVSPLKALNNDIQRNLTEPLEEIRRVFADTGEILPKIRVMTRSGDTPETDRRAMIAKPPSILITTPESLNILLTSKRGQTLLAGLKTVILDEVHAVAGNKRGTHLISALERTALLSGEFRRIALSATVNPMERIARFVGGRRLVPRRREALENPDAAFEARAVSIVQPDTTKSYALRVSFVKPDPPNAHDAKLDSNPSKKPGDVIAENPMWRASAEEMRKIIEGNRTTLVFANSRRAVERVARLINETESVPSVFAHHGSLSREIREVVETRLRDGELKGVVATNSLELGIDIGAVDEVLLFETPPSIASFVQRLGRAGHKVHEVSVGRLFALHAQDLLNAAVCASCLEHRDVEPISPPENPLDVAAQIILSMTASSPMRLDDIYDAMRTADPYASFPRKLFDLVVEMLAGKYEGERLVALRPMLAVDRIDGTAKALPSAVRALYSSGGTIADRGYFGVRTKDGVRIGELDEEFVWERKLGDIITLGVQSWRIEDIGHSDVIVTPHKSKAVQPPFWTCEERGTSWYFAKKRGALLEEADLRLDDPAFFESLVSSRRLDEDAARELIRYLKLQKSKSNGVLPHRTQLVVEHVKPSSSGNQALTVIHTEWGGRINRAFGIALQAALSEKAILEGAGEIRVMNDDTAVAIASETFLEAETLLKAVNADNGAALVRDSIHRTGFFGAEFRESAARSLLIQKAGFGRRTPLWLNRKRAKELREGLSDVSDFPVTLEAYRACLNDHLDLEALGLRLSEIEEGRTRVKEVTVDAPTPFAEPVLFKLTNVMVYEDDAVSGTMPLERSLIDEVMFEESLRPEIPADIVRELKDKLVRVHPGYTPSNADELLEWIKERVLIPVDEWRRLLSAVTRDHNLDEATVANAVSHRAVRLVRSDRTDAVAFGAAVVAVESLPRIAALRAWEKAMPVGLTEKGAPNASALSAMEKARRLRKEETPSFEDILSEQLRFLGPVSISTLEALFGVSRLEIEASVSSLAHDGVVIVDRITQGGSEIEVCHADVFRMLLRMTRARASRSLPVLPSERLPLFIAVRQKLIRSVGAYGNTPEAYGHTPEAYGNTPEAYGNTPEAYGNTPEAYGNTPDTPPLEEVLEPLFGRSASAELWEKEILPSRMPGYRTLDLDALLLESNLMWTAHPDETVSFCLSDERDLFAAPGRSKKEESVDAMFPSSKDRFTIAELSNKRAFDEKPGVLEDILFDALVQGRLSCSTFHPMRLGREAFKARRAPKPLRQSRWKHDGTDKNLWFRLERDETVRDALDEENLRRDRVKILLDRFGILFRELLEREMPPLQWGALFRTLRMMELAGDIIGGRFFEGVRGIQFIAKDALPLWGKALDPPPVYWMNAKDPASLCGVKIDGISLPPRIASTHLVYCGTKSVLISKQSAKNLTFHVEPSDPRLCEYLEVFDVMLSRDLSPVAQIAILKINNEPAWKSPFRSAFEARFDTYADVGSLNITKKR